MMNEILPALKCENIRIMSVILVQLTRQHPKETKQFKTCKELLE